MLYVKSILVGSAMLVVSTVLFFVILILVVSRGTGAAEVGVDVGSIIKSSPTFWMVALLAACRTLS